MALSRYSIVSVMKEPGWCLLELSCFLGGTRPEWRPLPPSHFWEGWAPTCPLNPWGPFPLLSKSLSSQPFLGPSQFSQSELFGIGEAWKRESQPLQQPWAKTTIVFPPGASKELLEARLGALGEMPGGVGGTKLHLSIHWTRTGANWMGLARVHFPVTFGE